MEEYPKHRTSSPSTTRAMPPETPNSTPKRSRKKKNQYSFTADSPYFTSYVDKEMKNLNVLTETLRDISHKASTFGKCGVLMSEATRRLSQSCKLKSSKNGTDPTSNENDDNLSEKEKQLIAERKNSVGEEMVGVLEVLGNVLDEIADAQMLMCESLEASLSLSLEAFIGTELQQAAKLKSEAEEMTESAEASFAKYLHGKNAHGTSSNDNEIGAVSSSWNKISEGVGNQLGRIGLTSGGNNELSPKRKAKVGAQDKKGEPVDRAIYAANMRQNLEEIRLGQSNSELKRFQLLKHLDALRVSQAVTLKTKGSRLFVFAFTCIILFVL